MSELWRDAMIEAFRDTMRRMALFLPKLMALVSFLLLGLIVGWITRAVLQRLMKALQVDALGERWGLQTTLVRAGVKQPVSQVMGRLVFWTIFVLFAFMGIDALDLPAAAGLMGQLVGFLPNMIAAGVLLLIGVLLSNFFAEAALIAGVNAQIHEARLVANLVRWGIWIFTSAMILTQLGIAKEIVIAAFSILFGGAVLAVAVALGLGGRNIAKDALERRWRAEKRQQDEMSHL